MLINARNKGKAGEREAINRILQPIVDNVCGQLEIEPIVLARNLQQSDSGGFDIIGLPWYAIEIKRCETLNLNRWWQQTARQAQVTQVPILLYRKNRMKWRCQLPVFMPTFDGKGLWVRSDIDITAFSTWFKIDLMARLNH